jgi:hypothetical protein
MSAGDAFSAFMTITGKLYMFGKNNEGQLGLNDLNQRLIPTINTNISNVRNLWNTNTYLLTDISSMENINYFVQGSLNFYHLTESVIRSNNNFLTLTRNTNTKYWFDEKKLKVYFFDVLFNVQETDSLSFIFTLKEFDCKTGFLHLILNELIYLELIDAINWGRKVPVIEPPTVSYNEYTKDYNFSFIFRNNNLDIGIVSLTLENKYNFELSKINAFIPFASFGELIHISR